MKVAILSDIHGNRRALEAVTAHLEAWQPDTTIVNGDVVNRGPLSRYCWESVHRRIVANGWRLVEGNHEAYVASWAIRKVDQRGTRKGIDLSSYWTFAQLDGLTPELEHLPFDVSIKAQDNSVVRCTHASMRGNRDGIYPGTPLEKVRAQIAPPPAVFCTAHTHRPLVRQVDATLVVNSGAAGTTFDGDTRASYVQLTWQKGSWQPAIIRVPYDRRAAARDFETSGYLAEGGALVKIFYYEWLLARPMINSWARRYQESVLAGEQSLASSVNTFLAAEVGTSQVDVDAAS